MSYIVDDKDAMARLRRWAAYKPTENDGIGVCAAAAHARLRLAYEQERGVRLSYAELWALIDGDSAIGTAGENIAFEEYSEPPNRRSKS